MRRVMGIKDYSLISTTNTESALSATGQIMTLEQYIEKYYGGNNSAFAADLKTANGTPVTRQQVNKWINAGCKVFEEDDGSFWLYHPTRQL